MQRQLQYFKNAWQMRHDRSHYWRRVARHFARQAIGELRYLTRRPRKGVLKDICPACGRRYNNEKITPPRVPLDIRCACCCRP